MAAERAKKGNLAETCVLCLKESAAVSCSEERASEREGGVEVAAAADAAGGEGGKSLTNIESARRRFNMI